MAAPMVQQLLPLLPKDLGQAALNAAMVGSVIGAGLWLTGARFSRPLITLMAVSLGGMLGMALPRWTGWNVNSMATAVGGAVLLGMSGVVLHRAWVGIGLGLLLACWAALVTWVIGGPTAPWTWPAVDGTTTLASFAQTAWQGLPEQVRKLLPYACGGAMLSGFLTALLWPRAAVVLLYSALGASLLVGMGLLAIQNGRPQWITIVPVHTWAQVLTLVCVVAFGAVLQWRVGPATEPQASSQEPGAAPREDA